MSISPNNHDSPDPTHPSKARPPDRPTEAPATLPNITGLISLLLIGVLLGLTLMVYLHRPTSVLHHAADTIQWQRDFNTAAALARVSQRPLLLRFTADWCQPCQLMATQVYPDPEVNQTIQAGFIPVIVDVSHRDSPGQELAVRYNVDAIPALIVLDRDQRVVARNHGVLWPDDLIEWLNDARAKAPVWPNHSANPSASDHQHLLHSPPRS